MPCKGGSGATFLASNIAYALAAGLIVFFVTRISRNLRARDAHLADLRQRSVEEEMVVRIALLASGAAPLARRGSTARRRRDT